MRGVVIFLGLLLLLAGGGVAAVQVMKLDIPQLASMPQVKDFVSSQNGLYAGGGVAGFGLLLMIIGAVTGGKKKEKPAKAAPAKASSKKAEASAPKAADPFAAKPADPFAAKAPAPQPAPKPVAPAPQPTPQPAAAKPVMAPPPVQPAPKPAPPPEPPKAQAKPQASAVPPPSAAPAPSPPPPPPLGDPRLMNRRRVQDLVTINDALKAYHAKHGGYPQAKAIGGVVERGANWIPGLAPDFLPELPRDPAMSSDKAGPQYVYASDGTNYKLLAVGISLVGSGNVEVLGVKIDPSRNPQVENASFGFWTQAFETV